MPERVATNLAPKGAHYGPTYLALAEPRFQLIKALCADFLSPAVKLASLPKQVRKAEKATRNPDGLLLLK